MDYVRRRRREAIYEAVCKGARRNMAHDDCAGVVISGQLTWKEEPNGQQLACAAAGGVGRCGSGDGRGKDVQYEGTQ